MRSSLLAPLGPNSPYATLRPCTGFCCAAVGPIVASRHPDAPEAMVPPGGASGTAEPWSERLAPWPAVPPGG
jgi:hypothetical protein